MEYWRYVHVNSNMHLGPYVLTLSTCVVHNTCIMYKLSTPMRSITDIIADHMTYSQSHTLKTVTWSSSGACWALNHLMHTFGTLALTWTLSTVRSCREERNVTVAPRQNWLGARTKRTGMCLAVVHVISNKTLRDHLAGFLCSNVVHSDDAVMVRLLNTLAFSSCIKQSWPLLHCPHPHTLKHLKAS